MRVLTRRIVFYVLTALVAITVDFLIPRLMPGNPVEALLARLQSQVTTGTIKSLEAQFGLNTKEGLWGQYMHYLANILHGNLGISTGYYPSTVASVIRGGLPWTLGLVGHRHRDQLHPRHGARGPGRLAARQLAGQHAARHDVLPGGAVLLHRVPGAGPVRHQARLVPHRPGLQPGHLPRVEPVLRR